MSEDSDVRPVATFEGQPISEMEGRLPAILMDMESGYARGTILRFQLEVRVGSVNFIENKKGELTRRHSFALEEVVLVSAFDPADRRDDVVGSASAHPTPTAEDAAELGIQIGRTSETWGQPTPTQPDPTHQEATMSDQPAERRDAYAGTGIPYFCPTAGEVEVNPGGGFNVCCDRPDLHQSACNCPAGSYDQGAPHEPYCRLVTPSAVGF